MKNRLDIVFDGSNDPGSVIINSTEATFDCDADARFVFDMLRAQQNYLVEVLERNQKLVEAIDRLSRLALE